MTRFYKLTLVSLIACSISTITAANAAQNNNFSNYSKAQQEKYKEFKTNYLDRYEKYRKEIKKKWGVAELSSKTEYVHYNEENKTKVLTDFENDTIEISILDADSLSDNKVNEIIREAIVDSLDKEPEIIANNLVDINTVEKKELYPTIQTKTPTILKYLDITSSKKLTSLINEIKTIPEKQHENTVVKRTKARLEKQISTLENFVSNDEIAPERIQESKALIVSMRKEKKSVIFDANNLIKKNIKTYKINLKRDRYRRAEHFLKSVELNAKKWKLSEQFILAIMETESHFNPLAKSYIPAYGLMQIVPSTAGADVHNKILGKKGIPTPELLFRADDNIKFGSAYIHILMTRYLKEIKNPISRLYCAIASYNTGIGNVARAFNHGKKGRLKAMKVINTLSPDEVYDIIKKRTHTETQRYLDKVLESKQYFTEHNS